MERTWNFLEFNDIYSGLLKAAVFGVIIAVVSCYQGFIPRAALKGSAGPPPRPLFFPACSSSSSTTSSPPVVLTQIRFRIPLTLTLSPGERIEVRGKQSTETNFHAWWYPRGA